MSRDAELAALRAEVAALRSAYAPMAPAPVVPPPTPAELDACVASAEAMGVTRDQILDFLATKSRLPSPHEVWMLAGGTAPALAVELAALARRRGAPAPGARSYVGPDRVAMRKSIWRPDGDDAKWVVAYFEAIVDARGKVIRIDSLRMHDGDDAQWPHRGADGRIVRTPPDPLDGSSHLVRAATFRAPHELDVGNFADTNWPNASDGEAWARFGREEIANFHARNWLDIQNEIVGRGVHELAYLRCDPHPEIGDPTITPATMEETIESLREEIRSLREARQ